MTDRESPARPLPLLAELLQAQAYAASDQPFAIFPEGSLSYGELHLRAAALAKGLIARGLKPGGHVAILMPNCANFLIAHFAAQLAGGISILLNARSRQQEIQHAIPHCDAEFLLTTSEIDEHVNFTHILADAFPELRGRAAPTGLGLAGAPRLRHIVLFGDKEWGAASSVTQVTADGVPVADEVLQARGARDAASTAVMIYTSGTTAAPKACELSHSGLQRSWEIYARAVRLGEGEKVWDPMPFFHSGGIGLMTGIMARGASIVSSAHFDPQVIVELIRRHRIEHLYPGFHLLALPIVQSPAFDRAAFEFVRTMVVVGPLGTLRTIQSRLPPRAKVLSLFGMSEGSGLVTLTPPAASEERRLGTSGPAPTGIGLRIVRAEDGAIAECGTAGEIQFRGGGAFRGYYKDPQASRETILPDGWVRTGDLGRLDAEGWLTYLGRLKDVLRVGGESVAVAEIESFLSTHPGVKIVQVIGKPDERLAEVPVAFVERNAGAQLSAQELIDYCQGKIARYKIPREVHFISEWPMSATKIQKSRLRELLDARPDFG
jgi:fatty-acyl-CoA synthase